MAESPERERRDPSDPGRFVEPEPHLRARRRAGRARTVDARRDDLAGAIDSARQGTAHPVGGDGHAGVEGVEHRRPPAAPRRCARCGRQGSDPQPGELLVPTSTTRRWWTTTGATRATMTPTKARVMPDEGESDADEGETVRARTRRRRRSRRGRRRRALTLTGYCRRMATLDIDAMIARFRERARAVKRRPLPPVAGEEREHFLRRRKVDYQDFAMIGDAEGIDRRRRAGAARRPPSAPISEVAVRPTGPAASLQSPSRTWLSW